MSMVLGSQAVAEEYDCVVVISVFVSGLLALLSPGHNTVIAQGYRYCCLTDAGGGGGGTFFLVRSTL